MIPVEKDRKIQLAPCIVVFAGVSLGGKTTLGQALAERTNIIFYDVDEVRWSIFEKRADQGYPEELPEPEHQFAMNITYQALHERARNTLMQGNPVALAASYSREQYHQMLKWLKAVTNLPMRVFLLEVPDQVAEQRLERRIGSRGSSNVLTMEHYFRIKKRLEPIEGLDVIKINTVRPIGDIVEEILAIL